MCKDEGMELAVPMSYENNKQIHDAMKSQNCSSIRLGIEDRTTEGSYNYKNNYKYWGSGEPNNMGNEDCTEMNKSDGKWNDINCNNKPKCFACSDHKPQSVKVTPNSHD